MYGRSMAGTRHHRRDALQCCPACAASVLGGRRRRPGSRQAWTWLTLLGIVAAMIPLAALGGGGASAVAQGAVPAAADVSLEPSPAPVAPEARPDVATAPKPLPPVHWRDSRAIGTPNAGRLENGVRLPVRGAGFYTYNPATQEPPGGADRTWGTAGLVHEIIDLGEWWARSHPEQPRLGIGDLSQETGGPFTGPVVGHVSHQNGLDVDIRLVRRDGAERAVDPAGYDRALTQAVVDRLVSQGARLVLVGPSLDLHGPSGVVMTWPAHDDHLHVRFG
jgi:hypothetical protein